MRSTQKSAGAKLSVRNATVTPRSSKRSKPNNKNRIVNTQRNNYEKKISNNHGVSENKKLFLEMDACRIEYRKGLKGHNALIYDTIAKSCEFAAAIMNDSDLWNIFHKEILQLARIPICNTDGSKVVLRVLKWMLNGSRDGAKNASLYSRAVSQIYHLAPKAIIEKLQKDGVRQLANSNAKNPKKKATMNRACGSRFAELWVDEIPSELTALRINSEITFTAVLERVSGGFVYRVKSFTVPKLLKTGKI